MLCPPRSSFTIKILIYSYSRKLLHILISEVEEGDRFENKILIYSYSRKLVRILISGGGQIRIFITLQFTF